jgi:phosphatidylglycerophosphate synthase
MVLAMGCVLFWIMQLAKFPMIQALLITVIIIVVTRVRLWYSKKQEK